ncbi:ImcF-related family protein [Ralstonia sp. 25C]|uniref:ImcF-related family protein n=1 Tax=Ralstonia sp. 25C TaxID=3447363 RepID=UPI003F753E68
MNRKFRLDLFGTLVLVVIPGLFVWYRPHWVGLAPENRGLALVVLCGIFLVLLLAFSFSDSSRPAVAWRALKQWVLKHGNRESSTSAADHPNEAQTRAMALRNLLAERHGWRWRYRDRWVLVAGDLPLVKSLAPGLIDTGYAISGGTVLLYAKQSGDALDAAWLDQIRRLRRRRPVDAIVAVVRDRSRVDAPFDADSVAHRLARHARALRWAAPAYLLNATLFANNASNPDEVFGFTWQNPRIQPHEVDVSLHQLVGTLADAGVVRLSQNKHDRYPAELSRHLQRLRIGLIDLVTRVGQSGRRGGQVHGVLFAPLHGPAVVPTPDAQSDGDDTLSFQLPGFWQTVADHSRTVYGRRVGFSLSTTAAWVTTALVACWIAGTGLSAYQNRATIQSAGSTLTKLSTARDSTQALLALDTLDKQIDALEVHQHDGAPWSTRFGLNRDRALLDALWPEYASAAARIVATPIRRNLEERLHDLASLTDAQIAGSGKDQVQAAYDTLKTYLMLAKPERASTAFLTPHLLASGAPARPRNSELTPGTWEDVRSHVIAFYVDHIGHAVPAPGSPQSSSADPALVAAARQTIISVRGIQNSTEAVYQQILEEASPKYPPLSLATLLGEAAGQGAIGGASSSGLFSTTETVPGIFTRAAWDERIGKAINDADTQRNVSGDWVLTDNARADAAPSALKAELRQRYFDDYARAWERFLNSLRWQSAATLSGTVDQLTLLGDPRRSPLVALMSAITYQAGAGAATQSLSDTLINKAQQLVGAAEKDPTKQSQPQSAPLAAVFGPILHLTGADLSPGTSANGKPAAPVAATTDLSLPRYLERVTAMRLKTQQIVGGADPDAMSRIAAQAVLQGRTSDIAESRDYASRVAASLGEEWAGFGDLFRAPLDQTWSVVVQPAAASLNDMWRTAIVADWNKSFGGRYPFADSDNDASLPEMARFLRPDNGAIAQFVGTQLAGVVERQGDRWVPAQGAEHGTLTVDPAFLAGLNRLTRVATVLFPAGDARVRYELRAVPTPGVTEMRFVLSGRELRYFNQQEEWTPFLWPGDALENLSHIEWQTEVGGLRSALDAQGRFGLIRLLERARVSQQDNARYLLSWQPDTSLGTPLRVQMRGEAGSGPLEVLQLRHFELPNRIFVAGPTGDTQKSGPSARTAMGAR